MTYRQVAPFPDMAEGTPQDMTIADFKIILEFLQRERIRTVLLTGNEAAEHPQFPDLINAAKEAEIVVRLETSGLFNPVGHQVVTRYGLPLQLKLYRPEFYTGSQLQELKDSCREFNGPVPTRLKLFVIADDPGADYRFAIDFIREMDIHAATFQVLGNADREAMRRFCAWVVPEIVPLQQKKVRISLDCGLPPCLFAEVDYGVLAKLDALPLKCRPRLGVLPDLSLYHCHQLREGIDANLMEFKDHRELHARFFRRYGELERNPTGYKECYACLSRQTHCCHGHCMATKQQRAIAELARLKQIPAPDRTHDDLTAMGVISWCLNSLTEAAEYLVAARQQAPENGHTHLLLARVWRSAGNFEQSVEEYQKAARLLPEKTALLMELSKVYQECGRLDESDRLLREVAGRPDRSAYQIGR